LEKLVAGDSRKKERKKEIKKGHTLANGFLFVSVKPEAELPTQEEMATQ